MFNCARKRLFFSFQCQILALSYKKFPAEQFSTIVVAEGEVKTDTWWQKQTQ